MRMQLMLSMKSGFDYAELEGKSSARSSGTDSFPV